MKYKSEAGHSDLASANARLGEVPGLTGLRFIAALAVAMAHGCELILRFNPSPRLLYWVPQYAGFGMTLFFVLSGFVIHYNYRITVTKGGLSGLGSFIWARFSRLYPLYFLLLVFDVLLGRKLFDYMSGNIDAFTYVLRALPFDLTLTQSWLYAPAPDSSLIYVTGPNAGIMWSISTEWFFYLAFPLITFIIIRISRPSFSIAAALVWSVTWATVAILFFNRSAEIDPWAVTRYGSIAGMSNGQQDSFFRWLMYFSPYLRIGEFILGCLLAQLYVQLRDELPNREERVVGLTLLVVGIVSVPVLTYLMYSGHWGWIRKLNYNFGLAPSVAVIIFCIARYDTFISRVLNSKPLAALGEASYSIYLTHFLVFLISASFLGSPLEPSISNLFFLFSKYFFLLGFILLISLGLHAYVEVPARRWLRTLWRQQTERKFAYLVFSGPALAATLLVMIAPVDSTALITDGLRITSATYGANCHAPIGNSTQALRTACNGGQVCDYTVDVDLLGDPAPGCAKNFSVEYRCAPGNALLTREAPGEAGLKSHLKLSCPATPSSQVSTIVPTAATAPSGQASSAGKTETAEPAEDSIRVQSATYGANCGAPAGNATSDVQMTCDDEHKCDYTIDISRLGNLSATCAKAFTAVYRCGSAAPVTVGAPAEAGLGSSVTLSCDSAASKPPEAANWRGIRVLSSTYGRNCGANIGNATVDVGSVCTAKTDCDYKVDVNRLSDPAHGCEKNFFVKYQCGGDLAARTKALPGEAGLGSVVHLSCE
jgi:peptidoglycan/LPS O-acetylase OafA/YrhL